MSQTLEMFVKSQVKICGEIFTKISHDLISRSGSPAEIRKICSHPLGPSASAGSGPRKNFPHVQLEEAGSTAGAAQQAAERSGNGRHCRVARHPVLRTENGRLSDRR